MPASNTAPSSIPLSQNSPQDPLAELRNLHLPQSIDAWPWAPGWYFLIAFIIISLSLSIYFFIKHKRASLYKRQALQELQNIKAQHETQNDVSHTAQALSSLLKKLALAHFSREQISLLSGYAWLQFLDQISHSQNFTQGAGTLLGERLFQKIETNETSNQELSELFNHIENLIKQLNAKKLKELRL